MRFKILAALSVVMAICAVSLSPAKAETTSPGVPQEWYSDNRIQAFHKRSPDQVNVQILEPGLQPFQTAFINYTDNFALGSFKSEYCESFKVAPCDQAHRLTSSNTFGKPRVFAQVMPKSCEAENDNFCIESIVETDGLTSQKLSLSEEINPPHWSFTGKETASQVEGDPEYGVPSGGSEATLWKNPRTGKSVLSSGNLYFHFEAGKIVLQQFSLELFDVMTIESPEYKVDPDRSVINLPVARSWNGYRCIYTFTSRCLVNIKHEGTSSYQVKLRTPSTFSGWFSGRMSEASLTLQKNKESVVYTISGQPATVPQVWGNVSKSKCLTTYCPDYTYVHTKLPDYAPWPKNFLGSPMPAGEATDPWDYFVNLFDNKAMHMTTNWSVSLVTGWGNSSCISNSADVTGFFTSNAMIYSGTPPVFKDGFFEYQVAGLHYEPDGVTPIKGTFDLIIKSEVARCLYGFNSAPISATISVLDESGQKSVSTSVVSEKDGFLRYSAAGFTFSAPKIQVKLTQVKQVVQKTKITCIKKKSVKTVVAVKPKCPTGYKKRN